MKAILVALAIYTLVIVFGYKKSIREYKEEKNYVAPIRDALNIINDIKKQIGSDILMTEKQTVSNKLSLTDLVTRKATIEEYGEIIGLLTKLAKNRFDNYQFTYYPVSEDNQDKQPFFLQIISNWHDDPDLHKLIFAKGIDYGINMQMLQKLFAEEVRAGNVINLGEDVMIITDDGTNALPTSVSPINSGLEGSEVAFIISFLKKDKYKSWCEHTFTDEQEEKKKGKTEDAKIQLVVNNG